MNAVYPLLGALVAALWSTSAAHGQVPAPQTKPNVLIILTDDQGTLDLNCYGSKDLVTPNLDALAARGTKFTQFYAAAAICSPSRAALLTGKTPQRAGLAHMASSARGGHGMPGAQVTVAEVFKKSGYATGHIGKWHLGYVPEESPNAQGFDYSFGFMSGCEDNYSHFFNWAGEARHDLWRNGTEIYAEGQYIGDLMVSECTTFLDRHKSEPFLLYWAINMPHYPLQGIARWREHYKALPHPRNDYAASISTIDEMVGTVLTHLKSLGLDENTIVVFQSDQGHSTEDRAGGGGGNAGPYRGAKFSFFEGGIRVPALLSWPGHLPQGVTRDDITYECDWLPTLASLCNVPLPTDATFPNTPGGTSLDGLSLLQPTAPRVLNWADEDGKAWAIRDGDWKLLANPIDPAHKAPLTRDDKTFLVNLAQDPGELSNLAKTHPDIVQRLSAEHEAWVKQSAGAP